MLGAALLLSFLGPESLIEKSRWFNPEHLSRAEVFFEHHGAKAIVLARFVPVARTFTPIVAGAGAMRYATFLTYNVAGGTLWGAGVTMLGFIFGDTRIVRENVELAILAIIGISLLPVVVESVRHRRTSDTVDAIDGRVAVAVGHANQDEE